MQHSEAEILYSAGCTRGYLLQNILTAEYRDSSWFMLHFAYISIDFPRINIQMIIISPKSFPYFPSAQALCSPGVSLWSLVADDPKVTPGPLVNWLNWAQLDWVLLSSSSPTEWVLWVPWARGVEE